MWLNALLFCRGCKDWAVPSTHRLDQLSTLYKVVDCAFPLTPGGQDNLLHFLDQHLCSTVMHSVPVSCAIVYDFHWEGGGVENSSEWLLVSSHWYLGLAVQVTDGNQIIMVCSEQHRCLQNSFCSALHWLFFFFLVYGKSERRMKKMRKVKTMAFIVLRLLRLFFA
jgi:hypothetical protein